MLDPRGVKPSGGMEASRTADRPEARTCPSCGKSFTPKKPEAICCSGRCRMAAHRERRRRDLDQRLRAAEAALQAVTSLVADLRADLHRLV